MWGTWSLAIVGALCACGRVGFVERTGTDSGLDADGATATGWSRVFAGDQVTCGIFDGRAYCWGAGTSYQLGDGNNTNRASPVEVALPAGTITHVAQGEGHGCALVDAAAYCWGGAPPGTGVPSSNTPVAVTLLPSPVMSISCGGDFTCAVANSRAYCWGNETSGDLGNGPAGSTMTPALVAVPSMPVAIEAGNDHAMALLADGSVSVWGHNDFGTFGSGSFLPDSSNDPVASAATTRLPSLGGWHACTVVGDAAQCWGRGTMGEIGDGQAMNNASPTAVPSLASGVTAIEANGGPTNFDATCAIASGKVSCWGNGRFGRLGNNATTNETTPVAVTGLPTDVVEIAVGYDHACARSTDGTLRCWGRGDSGQLGDGTGMTSMTPVIVPAP